MGNVLVIGSKNYSSWSLRAWLIARKVGLEFDELKLNLDTPEFAARIATWSPALTVPALKLGDDTLWDSLAIAETLAERHPDAELWPASLKLKAYARCISAEMHASFPALRSEMPMNCRATGRRVTLSDAAQRDVARVLAIWDECERLGAGVPGGLLGGFTVADAMYAPVASRFVTYGIELNAAATRFVEFVHDDPDMQLWLVDARAETDTLPHEERGQ